MRFRATPAEQDALFNTELAYDSEGRLRIVRSGEQNAPFRIDLQRHYQSGSVASTGSATPRQRDGGTATQARCRCEPPSHGWTTTASVSSPRSHTMRSAACVRPTTAGATTTRTYDEDGNLLTSQNAGIRASFTYDSRGMLVSASDGVGRQSRSATTSTRIPASWHQTLRASGLQTVTRSHDPQTGWLSGITHPDGASEAFSYDPDGQVKTHTMRNGVHVTYAYDAGNRMIRAVPGLAGGASPPAHLAPLDGGDARAATTRSVGCGRRACSRRAALRPPSRRRS